MQVDSSVELGRDDPALELPWCSEDGCIRYQDLKRNPELIGQVPEAQAFSELRQFLLRINAPDCPLQTAKSDAWTSGEISPEEEIFAARRKFVSYVDLLFAAPAPRVSLESHVEIVKKLSSLLQRAPEMPAAIEFIVRHCHYHSGENQKAGELTGEESVKVGALSTQGLRRRDGVYEGIEEPSLDLQTDSSVGFCITAYVSGFGDHDAEARQHWEIALKLLQHAIIQATRP